MAQVESYTRGATRVLRSLMDDDRASKGGREDEATQLSRWSATRLAAMQAVLNQRLGPEFLSQRPGPGGGGRKLTYIEGWRVVDLANEVFGFNGWSTSVRSLEVDFLDVQAETGRCQCGVSAIVRITLQDGAYHEDVGYGHAEGVRGKHAALEKCKKEAITDSIKRGLKTFGRLLGNCLYDQHYTTQLARMSTPARPPLQPRDLYRGPSTKRPAPDDGPTRPRPKAAPVKEPPSDDLWNDDSEAATMALELELEDDMLLRQSQIAQELDENV